MQNERISQKAELFLYSLAQLFKKITSHTCIDIYCRIVVGNLLEMVYDLEKMALSIWIYTNILSSLLGSQFGRKICFSKATLADNVAIAVVCRADNVKWTAVVEEFRINAELPLKVNHKHILMLLMQKRAVVWQVDAAFLWGISLLIYQCDNRPILITLRYSTIICHCQADQDCANWALRCIHPNQKPIDYFSCLSHCTAERRGGQ